jgi:DNA sulfur modification protein DndB
MKPKNANEKFIFEPRPLNAAERKACYLKRRDSYDHCSVFSAELARCEQEGWEVERAGKIKIRMRRPKAHDVALQDQTWCLFYRMGYPVQNTPQFKLKFFTNDGVAAEREIDVFAKDDETVVVAECKSKETRGRRALQKDLEETASLQKTIINAFQFQFGGKLRPKFIWLYVTKNIIWSEPDVERANAVNVRIVTENEMQYFDSFVRHMGPASRFQFLAEFLSGQSIPGLSGQKVAATRGELGGRRFYSFVSTPRHLLKIAFVNHQALNHPDGRPAYQRMISPGRIKEIQEFIKKGGYFPTNILINFVEKSRFDLLPNKENSDPKIKFGWLYLPDKYKSALVIDGQHRLYGYSHLSDLFLDQPIVVIAFEQMPVKEEAELFVTINQKQKSVQPNVIVSLQAELKIDSTDAKERLGAIAAAIAKQLDIDPSSPLMQRFTVHGVLAEDQRSLTVAEFVNGLVRSGLLGRVTNKNHVPGPLSGKNDQETIRRTKRFLNIYFSALRDANVRRWEGARDHYISTNPSIRAHFLLIAETIRYLESKKNFDASIAKEEELAKKVCSIAEPVFEFIKNSNDDEIKEQFSRKFGEGGVKDYFENLCQLVCKTEIEFGSQELRTNLALKSDKRISIANADIYELGARIQDTIFAKLKETHGVHELKSGQKAYWEIGVQNQKAKTGAYQRQVEDTREKQAIEAYLNFLELRDIIKQPNNWSHLGAVFNIQMPGEKKGNKYYLDWMDKFNELRRIPAHPSGGRTYVEEDYEFIKFIKDELAKRLPLM